MFEIDRVNGPMGEIQILESKGTGARYYFEDEIFQSFGTRDGHSLNGYVHLMAYLVRRCSNVLMLGCGGGTLATMLARNGQNVTVVDNNPVSFDLARRHFGMPDDIPCVTADFRDYLLKGARTFDGVAIDVSSPGFNFSEEFDPATCQIIRQAMRPNTRIAINLIVAHDLDQTPDRIAQSIVPGGGSAWILDQPGMSDRNAIVTCGPPRHVHGIENAIPDGLLRPLESWVCRRPRRSYERGQR